MAIFYIQFISDHVTIISYHYVKQKGIIQNKRYEFKDLRISNGTFYYFDDIIKLENFDLDKILIDRKPHENILIYDISYKTFIDPKPLRLRLDKIDGFIRIFDGTRYLTLFGSEKSLKSSITFIFSHYFAAIKVDSYDSLPIEKNNVIMLTLPNVIIPIKSVLNKNKKHYYYNIFL